MTSEEPSSLYEQLGGHDGILEFIRTFYIDVRQHNILGPVFNSHIDDWEEHLAKITEFWALQTGGPSTYRGGFAGVHIRAGIQPEFFEHWLGLWDYNCQRHLSPELGRKMSALAHELGRRLRTVLEGLPR